MDDKNYPSPEAVDENKDDVVTLGMNGSLPQKEQTGDDSLPAVDENKHGVVVLLVGNKEEDKKGVVNSLTRSGNWIPRKSAVDSSGDGVLILTGESAARVIVDTTPLKNVPGRSPVAIARRWISRNHLRRLLSGKDVVVVCVVTCRVRNTCTWDMFSYSNCWVDVFGLIFKEHKAAIMVLVNTDKAEDVTQETEDEVARFVLEHGLSPKNITYSNLKKGDDSVSNVIEDCIRKRKNPLDRKTGRVSVSSSGEESARLGLANDGVRPRRWESCWQFNRQRADTNYIHRTVMPFTINDTFSQKYEALAPKEKFRNYETSPEKEKFGPWGPERVILFGRTGSGKSTLAQMLTLGALDMENVMFDPSTGIRGGTKGVQAGIGRGWYVLDTPGFGEPKDPRSTIPTRQVEAKIKEYVRVVEGTFSHYIYVVKKGRFDLLDEKLWQFFTTLFGEEIKRQFTVVVSGCDEEWIQENIEDLNSCFKGCESFLRAEFPCIDKDDGETEREYQEMRTESLSQLEQNLAALNRSDMVCKYGRSARLNIWMETVRANLDLGIERSERIKFLVRGASLIFACCNISRRPLAELTNILKVHDKISLIPE